MAIDPSGTDLARFLAADDGPFVMLNLLRFRPDGGRQRYLEYAQATAAVLPRFGGEVVYAGDGDLALAAEDGQTWDAVLCVRYPSRRAFCEMVADPEYQQLVRLRTEALAEAVLQPTRPWG
jgi:uncharacterized protein (DUF1330 family)